MFDTKIGLRSTTQQKRTNGKDHRQQIDDTLRRSQRIQTILAEKTPHTLTNSMEKDVLQLPIGYQDDVMEERQLLSNEIVSPRISLFCDDEQIDIEVDERK